MSSLAFSRLLQQVVPVIAAVCVIGVMETGCTAYETENVTDNPVTPDELDDTAPPEAALDRSLDFRGRSGQVENHSTERFRFDIAAYNDDAERSRAEKLYPSHAAWLKAFAYDQYAWTVTPSVQTIGTYVKQLDDQIYAGIEIAVQQGLESTYAPKTEILQKVLDYLTPSRSGSDDDDAIVYVATALRLGGQSVAVPSDLESAVQQRVDDFEHDMPAKSVPFGFYTWSETLKQIWKQDRYLQLPTYSPGASCKIAEAISSDPETKQRYVQLVDMYGRLTNPVQFSLRGLLDSAGGSCHTAIAQPFLGISRSAESDLFAQLYPQGVPADADLMDDLVNAIRGGKIDLTPRPEDGWYQYQIYALETLLVTDKSETRKKVSFMGRYKKRLREAFETMLTQHRETHAKQTGETADIGEAPPPVPHFRLEPMASVYVRHARSYVFLEAALDKVLGPQFLDRAVSVSKAGPGTESVRDMIHRARDRFYGVYLISCYDLGMPPNLNLPGDPEKDTWETLQTKADKWLIHLPQDPIANHDVRVIIPIAKVGEHRMKYWTVLGVRSTLAGYSYIHGQDVSPPEPSEQARVWLPTEQFAEVESSDVPLTRDQFRALCDKEGSAGKIIEALQSR